MPSSSKRTGSVSNLTDKQTSPTSISLPPVEPSKKHVVVFDFDGVLAEDSWPSPLLGAQIRQGVELLQAYYKAGHAIRIYTSRPAAHRSTIWEWLYDHGIGTLVYEVICDKPLAGLYIDDRGYKFERTEGR